MASYLYVPLYYDRGESDSAYAVLVKPTLRRAGSASLCTVSSRAGIRGLSARSPILCSTGWLDVLCQPRSVFHNLTQHSHAEDNRIRLGQLAERLVVDAEEEVPRVHVWVRGCRCDVVCDGNGDMSSNEVLAKGSPPDAHAKIGSDHPQSSS